MSRTPKHNVLTARAIAFAVITYAAPLLAGDWPQWRGPNRDAVSTETGLLGEWTGDGPATIWHATGIGSGYPSVVISNGAVFTMGKHDSDVVVTSLDSETGEALWRTKIGTTERIPCSTPTVDGQRVYAVDPDGELVCLKAATGDIIWQTSFVDDFGGRMMSGRGYGESPLIDGEKLICTPGGVDAMMVALNKHSGELLWKATIPELGPKGRDGSSFPSAVVTEVAGIRQYVQFVGRGLIGIEAQTGKFLWGYNDICNATANIPTPIVRGDLVFAANGYSSGSVLLKLVPDGGHGTKAVEIYRLSGGQFQNHHGGVVLIGNHVYGGHGSNNGLPTCLDLESGKRLWRRRGPGTGSAAVVYADGRLYFRYQDGVMALIEATTAGYRLKGRFNIPGAGGDSWSHPVVSHGRLYLREQDDLWVYDVARHRSASAKDNKTTTMVTGPFATALQDLGCSIESLDGTAPSRQQRIYEFVVTGSPKENRRRLLLISLNDKHLVANGKIVPKVMAALRRLPAPFALSLAGTRVRDAALEPLGQLDHLVALDLESCEGMSDAGIRNVQHAPALRAMILTGTRITNDGLEPLLDLKSLVALDLEVCNGVTDAGLVHLGRMKQLQAIVLKKTGFEPKRVTDVGLKHLQELTALRQLDLYGNSISDAGLVHLGRMVNLEQLNLSLTQVTDDGLARLSPLEKLRRLDLLYSVGFAGPQVTDVGLEHLRTLTELRSLNLVGAKITDEGIKHVGVLGKLQSLELVNTEVTDAGVASLQEVLLDCRIKR